MTGRVIFPALSVISINSLIDFILIVDFFHAFDLIFLEILL